jgi:hypothetical protein
VRLAHRGPDDATAVPAGRVDRPRNVSAATVGIARFQTYVSSNPIWMCSVLFRVYRIVCTDMQLDNVAAHGRPGTIRDRGGKMAVHKGFTVGLRANVGHRSWSEFVKSKLILRKLPPLSKFKSIKFNAQYGMCMYRVGRRRSGVASRRLATNGACVLGTVYWVLGTH